MRVTVLLPVHDGEPYVGDAVRSVLEQTFDDFELLVVDDGSTDGTAETLASFHDPRLRVIRNERNVGLVASLNRGLAEARGEYVARIDADDRCLPQRLERQVAVLDAEPRVGLVGSWMELVDASGEPAGRLVARISDFAELLYYTLIMYVLVSHPAAMFRREAVLAVGGYDPHTFLAEDKDLWRRLALARWDARIVQEPLVVYRLHDDSITSRNLDAQRAVDADSQERFLATLAPAAPERLLRLLLAGQPGVWREPGDPVAALEQLLAAAQERLRLVETERGRLEELLRARVLEVARRRPVSRRARALAAWAGGGFRPRDFALAPAHAALPVARRGWRSTRRVYAKLGR
jgi:glycosyltransferase involved in cell wall biosynthesis